MKDDPAFPVILTGQVEKYNAGLTIREYFAGLAMQGLIAHSSKTEVLAKDAVRAADALIAELNKKES